MKVKIQIKGVRETNKVLASLEKKIVDYCYNLAIQDLAEYIGNLSAPRVPVKEGILKSSFTIQKIGKNWVCGYNTEYAMYIHQGQRADGTHVITENPGGGGSFYLSSVIDEDKTKLINFLQRQFTKYFNSMI
jgi:hypothetical protein